MLKFFKNLLEVFGIVYLRFPMISRIWCVWLVGVNAACLYFINHIEAQVVLAVTGVAVAIQTIAYGKIGFTRIMGAVHIFWVPMFAWMAMRADIIQANPALANWIAVLFATNLISMIIDAIEATRFVRGDREPNYRWNMQAGG